MANKCGYLAVCSKYMYTYNQTHKVMKAEGLEYYKTELKYHITGRENDYLASKLHITLT